MRRREFCLAVATGLPLLGGARAQPSEQAARLGILLGYSETDKDARARLDQFLKQLASLGWEVGRNLRLDTRWASGDPAEMRAIAQEVVDGRPNVILTHTTPVTAAAHDVAGATPIVFLMVSDPVGSGFVDTFARPGGNSTGIVNVDASLGGKWLEVLHEIAPDTQRVALLYNPLTAPYAESFARSFREAAVKLGVQGSILSASKPADIAPVLTDFVGAPGAGLVALPDVFITVNRNLIIDRVAELRLPAIYPYSSMAREGGLVSYGIDQTDVFRRAAAYVDRLLRGARPADLPVQSPEKFEFVINLKAAKAMGRILPDSVVQRADEVIE